MCSVGLLGRLFLGRCSDGFFILGMRLVRMWDSSKLDFKNFIKEVVSLVSIVFVWSLIMFIIYKILEILFIFNF